MLRHVQFLLFDLTLGIDILFEKLTQEIGSWIWKTSFARYASGVRDFMQSLSSFLIYLVVTCFLAPCHRSLPRRTGSIRKLYMVPYHNCLICETWRGKEVRWWEVLKSSYKGEKQILKGVVANKMFIDCTVLSFKMQYVDILSICFPFNQLSATLFIFSL